jgi:excisionase family DNA binding protein
MTSEFEIGGPRPGGLTRAELMTPDEVAVLLAVPVSTVRDWARRGLIPSRKLGRHRRFLRSEIENWVIRDRVA